MKHIDVRYILFVILNAHGNIDVSKIKTHDNLTDMMARHYQ